MSVKPECGTCKHWHRINARYLQKHVGENAGECYQSPPAARWGDDGLPLFAMPPVTSEDYCCNQWEE